MARNLHSVEGMEAPPKIEPPAKLVPLEVLPNAPVAPPQPTAATDGPPIHALSALILAAVDSLWAIFDWAPPIWIVTIPFCFFAVLVPAYLIQRHLKKDSHGRALAISTLLAVLAAIPTPITGTPVGLGLLAWSGLGKLFGRNKNP